MTQQPIRLKRLVTLAGGAALAGFLMSGVAAFAYHPVMVMLNDGHWCVTVEPSEQDPKILYGNDCHDR